MPGAERKPSLADALRRWPAQGGDDAPTGKPTKDGFDGVDSIRLRDQGGRRPHHAQSAEARHPFDRRFAEKFDYLATECAIRPEVRSVRIDANGSFFRVALRIASATESLEGQLENEARAMARVPRSDDAWNAMRAMLAKQKPVFEGR
jgi:hypothetical protein